MAGLKKYLVEQYFPKHALGSLRRAASRARAAADEAPEVRNKARYLTSILVPEEETLFQVFEAATEHAARAAAQRAGLEPQRVLEVLIPDSDTISGLILSRRRQALGTRRK